jgi:glycine cleavage system regulatory protein
LTVIGPDKPGLVEKVSDVVAAHEANWEESSMARIAGRFAGILHVTVDEARADGLAAALAALEPQGLKVVVERADDVPAVAEHDHLHLELVGNDRPGIIREISRALAEHGINVEQLHTECTEAPMAGGTLFQMQAALGVPKSVSIDELREVLEGFAHELMVDITLEPSR